jgi:hypothetical protein
MDGGPGRGIVPLTTAAAGAAIGRVVVEQVGCSGAG